jgi:hypothetical protein
MSPSARLGRRLAWIAAAALAAAFAAGTISWTRPSRIVLVDQRGAPASDTYVRYHYEADILNFVDSLSRVTRGSAIVRADADGGVRIPFSLHFRNPLRFSMPPSLNVDCVVVPRLHNSFGPVGKHTTSRPGVFTIDGGWQHLTVFDLTDDPERWVASLRELHRCIGDTISRVSSRAADPDDEVTLAYVRELIGHLRGDYAAFVERHGQAPLTRPAPPEWHSEQERKAWEEQVDAQLAREPRWGEHVGMWRRELKTLDEWEAFLK